MKCVLCMILLGSMFSVGSTGCAEKPPAKNEIKVSTPGGTTVTIERPNRTDDRNPPPANP